MWGGGAGWGGGELLSFVLKYQCAQGTKVPSNSRVQIMSLISLPELIVSLNFLKKEKKKVFDLCAIEGKKLSHGLCVTMQVFNFMKV